MPPQGVQGTSFWGCISSCSAPFALLSVTSDSPETEGSVLVPRMSIAGVLEKLLGLWSGTARASESRARTQESPSHPLSLQVPPFLQVPALRVAAGCVCAFVVCVRARVRVSEWASVFVRHGQRVSPSPSPPPPKSHFYSRPSPQALSHPIRVPSSRKKRAHTTIIVMTVTSSWRSWLGGRPRMLPRNQSEAEDCLRVRVGSACA